MSIICETMRRQLAFRGFAPGLVLALAVHTGSALLAQTPKPKASEAATVQPETKTDDPKARALFDELVKAYKGLKAYTDQGQFESVLKTGDKVQKQVIPLKLTFVRPDKFDFDAGEVRMSSDGKTMTTAVVPLKRYMSEPAPRKVGLATLGEGPIGAAVFGGPAGPPMYVLLNLLTDTNPAAALADLGGTFQRAPAAAPNSKAATAPKSDEPSILIDLEKGRPDILLVVDPATKLLSRIEMVIDPEQKVGSLEAGQSLEFGWHAGAVSTKVAADRSFAFAAPKDFIKVDAFVERKAEPPAHKSVGKPAPDFTLTVLDGPGKTKTITKAELAGKVVVIAFWATWCEPCWEELPEIQKLVEQYAQSDKKVVIVALDQDDEPAELSQVRTRVEKALDGKKIKLAKGTTGFIAVDPSKSVGDALEVEGYPTLVILDAKGVIRVFREGIEPGNEVPLHESIGKSIEAVLAGKPIVAPAAKKAAAKKAQD